MLFYEKVDTPSHGGAAAPMVAGGECTAPLSPMPETGDKLAQLQVLACMAVGGGGGGNLTTVFSVLQTLYQE